MSLRSKQQPLTTTKAKLISSDAATHELEVISIVANSRGNVTVRISNTRPTKYGNVTMYSIGGAGKQQDEMDTTLDIEISEDAAEGVYIGQRFRVHIEALS